MVERVGEACSNARAQVAGRILPSMHCHSTAGIQPPTSSSLICVGVAERERSGPVRDWEARNPKTGWVQIEGELQVGTSRYADERGGQRRSRGK